jgi:hypothetical protein
MAAVTVTRVAVCPLFRGSVEGSGGWFRRRWAGPVPSSEVPPTPGSSRSEPAAVTWKDDGAERRGDLPRSATTAAASTSVRARALPGLLA